MNVLNEYLIHSNTYSELVYTYDNNYLISINYNFLFFLFFIILKQWLKYLQIIFYNNNISYKNI